MQFLSLQFLTNIEKNINVNSSLNTTFHVINMIYVPFRGVSQCCNKDKGDTVQDQIKMQLISLCDSLCNWERKIKK